MLCRNILLKNCSVTHSTQEVSILKILESKQAKEFLKEKNFLKGYKVSLTLLTLLLTSPFYPFIRQAINNNVTKECLPRMGGGGRGGGVSPVIILYETCKQS